MRSPNTEQVSEKSKERNYRTVLDIVNFNIVILNTILTIILGPTLLSLLGIIVCGILFYASKRNIPETIVFLLVYPLGWLILLNTERRGNRRFFNVDCHQTQILKLTTLHFPHCP